MTLTVKLLLITALVLSIIIPFGYFLIGENLEVSLDSRVFGRIEKSDVHGIVVGNLF